MKLVAQLKRVPTPEQATALRHTLERANAACHAISRVAWEQQTFGTFALQQLTYARIKADYGLGAQLTIRCLAKVGDSYNLDRSCQRSYSHHGSIAFDDRILSFKPASQTVSIWTVSGRATVAFVCGERQARLLRARQGESDLVYRRGAFYLLVTEKSPPQAAPLEGQRLGGLPALALAPIVARCVDFFVDMSYISTHGVSTRRTPGPLDRVSSGLVSKAPEADSG